MCWCIFTNLWIDWLTSFSQAQVFKMATLSAASQSTVNLLMLIRSLNEIQKMLDGTMAYWLTARTWINFSVQNEKKIEWGVHRFKEHIANVTQNIAQCWKSLKKDQLICRNALNEPKLKMRKKDEYVELRSTVNIENAQLKRIFMEMSCTNLSEPTNHHTL